MTEELEQLLKNLKLRRMLNVYDEQLKAAEKAQTSYSEFVAGLLRSQWHDRQESALEWRIQRANLPERWSLETFPWTRQPGVNRKQMRTFGELDFVARHENLVLTGPTGVGKTGLACGHSDASVLPATRAYFTFDYLGHGDQAALLDGGLEKWKSEGRALTK